uniref:Neuromedin Ba n=1 Tax=Gasterosteus aculeatus aculeatus TaxID=481459 RepID=A0AAQ4Q6X9_GASAC
MAICRAGFLSSFILVYYIAMTSSMTPDLTELRNKVSKIRMTPKGNLWATGHFMGKKSVMDSPLMKSAFEDVKIPTGRAVSLHRVEDLKALLFQMWKTAQQTQQKHALNV